MDLSEVPTIDLLEEIGRRCSEGRPKAYPAWAAPVIEAVCEVMQVTVRDLLLVRTRTARAVLPRQLAMAFLYWKVKGQKQTTISALWGQDHAMVSHATQAIERRRRMQPGFATVCSLIEKRIDELTAARRTGEGATPAACCRISPPEGESGNFAGSSAPSNKNA